MRSDENSLSDELAGLQVGISRISDYVLETVVNSNTISSPPRRYSPDHPYDMTYGWHSPLLILICSEDKSSSPFVLSPKRFQHPRKLDSLSSSELTRLDMYHANGILNP